jgi:hypothetical protein
LLKESLIDFLSFALMMILSKTPMPNGSHSIS